MTSVKDSRHLEREDLRREVGHAGGWAEGPTVVFVGGLHGNEPAGVEALRRVFALIEDRRIAVRGEALGLAGNLQALGANRRFLTHDLNRVWSRARVEEIDSGLSDGSECVEQAALLARIRTAMKHARGPVHVVDLHTASGDTPPFVVLGDTLRNREFGRGFPLPVVLGLEEHVRGTLMEWVTGLGHLSLAIEAGQHGDPRSLERHMAAIWMTLALAGSIEPGRIPDLEAHRVLLSRASAGIPRLLEVFHRHPIAPGERFRMRAGFGNFDRVRKGAPLAEHLGRVIEAPRNGRMLLPLYQDQGEDGFFLARPVNPVWLVISAWMRRVGLPGVAHWLPGVSRHPERRDTLVVNTAVARFFTRKLFHLLGYRIEGLEGRRLTVRERDQGPAV